MNSHQEPSVNNCPVPYQSRHLGNISADTGNHHADICLHLSEKHATSSMFSNPVRHWVDILLLSTLLTAFASSILPTPPNLLPPEVNTKLGKIQGKREMYNGSPVNVYLGVPFANPPTGDLRFKKPEPIERYTNTIKADKMPPACNQYASGPFPWYDSGSGQSEDCLYMNIWVPALPSGTRGKPVMFWIFGGGFFLGSIRSKVFDGRPLAITGDVIVVTVSYRLGPMGFLTSGTKDAPGNVGMYDMLEGLKWVNNNIEAFGGDSKKITIMGESAGSISVGLLTVSPLTKGLYHRAIMESGSPAYLLADNNTQNLAFSQELAKAVGCADDSKTIMDNSESVVKCLRRVDAMTLCKTMVSLKPGSSRYLLPQYGDEILPSNPRLAVASGQFHDTDLLIGNNRDEGSFQITTSNVEVFGFHGQKDPKINKTYGESMLRKMFKTYQNTHAIVRHYLGNLTENDFDEVRRQVYTASGDASLLCPDMFFAEKFAEKMNNVFYYFFTHRPSTSPWAPWMGVAHFEEVQFVFGQPTLEQQRYKPGEPELSTRMMRAWTNFAKHGIPGRNWPKYSKEDPKIKILNEDSKNTIRSGPHRSNCDVFRPVFGF